MIRHLNHSEIDKPRWDATIDQSFNGMVYAKSWYLDIVSPGWEALVRNDYQTVFPLTRRQKFGIQYLHQPFFTQQLGIFTRLENIFEIEIKEFLSLIPLEYRLIEIQLNRFNHLNSSEFNTYKRLTHLLDLKKPYEEIRSGYSNNLKRNIKAAQESNVKATPDFSVDSLVALFQSNKGKDVQTLKEKDYLVFKKLIEEATQRNLISKLGIEINGRLAAGAIFLKSNSEYIFLFSATNDEAKKAGAMSMIIDTFIQNHAGEKMNLDFEGSMDKGLARFYKSFGSQEVVYLQIRKNRLPLFLRWLK